MVKQKHVFASPVRLDNDWDMENSAGVLMSALHDMHNESYTVNLEFLL